MNKKLPVGISDFKDVVTGDYLYVDKTLLIKEIIDKGDKILLIPRPRRFGKTLNLSMIKYFYDCAPETWSLGPAAPGSGKNAAPHPHKELFDSLAIMKTGGSYLEKMGRHPVIFFSFRGIKELDWNSCLDKIKQLIQDEYLKQNYLQDSPHLASIEKDYFKRVLHREGTKGDYENSLEKLLIFISRHHGKRTVILIDEYDAPLHAGFTYGYYDKVINFMRNFLCGGLKDTDKYLEKSVLTGIMRIAKESIFSGLNNPGVYTLLSTAFNDKFGFTENEVQTMLREFNLMDKYDGVRDWYNGYRFGETVIYNPWSIINFLGEDSNKIKPYWVNTSDNAIVESLLSRGGKVLKEELEQLAGGETIEKIVDDNIVLKNVDSDENSLWSFLLMGGYLKTTAERMVPATGEMVYKLSIPNREVMTIYSTIIKRYFSTKIENKKLETMLKALLDTDIKLFEKMLRKVVAAVFSYHDFSGEPEKVYHALAAGMLIWISDTHQIKSNRESGYGRYDIMIIPRSPVNESGEPGLPGFVIEFKTVDKEDNETVESALAAALAQIEEKKYETELLERGLKRIVKLAIVFSGKSVYVKEAEGK